jgi:hypothetical protein
MSGRNSQPSVRDDLSSSRLLTRMFMPFSCLLLAGNAGSLAQAITQAAAKGASADVLAKAATQATTTSPASPAANTGSSPVRDRAL